jgi:hypothetical protein
MKKIPTEIDRCEMCPFNTLPIKVGGYHIPDLIKMNEPLPRLRTDYVLCSYPGVYSVLKRESANTCPDNCPLEDA